MNDWEEQNQKRMLAYYKKVKEMQNHKNRDAKNWDSYVIMHGEQKVACIYRNGYCKIYAKELMPYHLYLEPVIEEDLDIRVQNLNNFYYWCASRMLTLDRTYAKEILNSIGAKQAQTDRDRAQIALSYHCLSLMDIYWVRESYERIAYADINLYENHLAKAFIDVSLRGKQLTIQNSHLIADDLSTGGCYPKAWIRKEDGFWLMKDGSRMLVENELLASKISRCFRVDQVYYEEGDYDGQKVSVSKLITTPEQSIVSMEQFEIYAVNQDMDKLEYVLELDGYSYYMMNILDYLVGNTDRHWGNWGLLIDNRTNRPLRLHALMDFNQAFQMYDTVDGANCLTSGRKQTQKEAAIEAVQKVGLNQVEEVRREWFEEEEKWDMFCERLRILKEAERI